MSRAPAFGDRTTGATIHARNLGRLASHAARRLKPPHAMGAYIVHGARCSVVSAIQPVASMVRSAILTLTSSLTPLSKNPDTTSNERTPLSWRGEGWEVSFFVVAVLDIVLRRALAAPL